LAIENSMLGATHACAHPLTSHFGIPHGVAIALMLASVVNWNREVAASRYEELFAGDLVARLRELASRAELPSSLHDVHVPEEALPRLAEDAAAQWTGRFNPRSFDAAAALEIYRSAY
jgi:alcohol dehydrogenase